MHFQNVVSYIITKMIDVNSLEAITEEQKVPITRHYTHYYSYVHCVHYIRVYTDTF